MKDLKEEMLHQFEQIQTSKVCCVCVCVRASLCAFVHVMLAVCAIVDIDWTSRN